MRRVNRDSWVACCHPLKVSVALLDHRESNYMVGKDWDLIRKNFNRAIRLVKEHRKGRLNG